MPSRLERVAAAYFGGHAVLDIVWWITVTNSSYVRGWFELDSTRRSVLSAFFVPDSVILGVVSAIAAVALLRGWRSANALVAGVTGGSAYATFYLAGWVANGGHGWFGVVAMSLETAVMVVLVVALVCAASAPKNAGQTAASMEKAAHMRA